MSSSQVFSDRLMVSSSASRGSKPHLIIKPPQPAPSSIIVPLSNALASIPPKAKKMWCTAFKCSTLLRYPLVPVSLDISSPLPINIQSIFDNTYLANSSPEVLEWVPADEWRRIFSHYPAYEYCALHGLHSSCSLHSNSLFCSTCESNYATSKKFCSFKSVFHLLQFHILAKIPLAVAYHYASSCGFFAIQDEEWTAIKTGLWSLPYYQDHLEELGFVSEKLRSQGVKRKAGKEVVCDAVDDNVDMEVPKELDAMNLDYPEEVPPPPTPIPTASTPIWKAVDNRSYSEVSSLTTWFFEPLVKQVPSDGSSLTQDEMVKAAVECVITRMASLFAGPGKKMLKQDLWALVDGLIQGVFAGLKEHLQQSPSKPPASFSSESLLCFVDSLSVINMTSANIIDAQQDELLQAYQEYQVLLQKLDHLETKNLHLKEQVSLWDSQLEEKDEELNHLKSFVRHFKGDIPLTEVQQLRGAMEARDSEIEELKKELAANHLVDAAESISQVRVVKGQSNEIHKLRELLSRTTQEFGDKMLELSRDTQEARYLHKTAEVAIKEQDWVIKEFIYKELHCLLNIGDLPLEPVTTSTVAPMDIWGGPSSESFPFKMKSDSTPNSLSNFVPSLDTTSLPSTLVETHNTSPVVIFLSGHPNAYFVRTGEDPLTYSLVEKNEDELADPSLHMALTLQDIWEQMEIKCVEDLYAQELEEVFGIPFDIRAKHDKLIELSFD
ncbi:hypothetical protein GYMLUDRAFT_252928 [Collybiopsis luxurians FD-317 M1]|uniref:Uncharacterized protein n=1 Tax=Collybiopsis luxurians FD-317 M1 TaxID=944289 RepID=A0A0D0B8R1_9AGAR|nr:hypothetical protein GYMLUDRAFT_252928 [Collybiopsis luxurians FD-317 M1]